MLVAGTAAEAGLVEEVVRTAGTPDVRALPATALPVFTALVARAAVALVNNSGGLHLADAVGTPVVVDVRGDRAARRRGPAGGAGRAAADPDALLALPAARVSVPPRVPRRRAGAARRRGTPVDGGPHSAPLRRLPVRGPTSRAAALRRTDGRTSRPRGSREAPPVVPPVPAGLASRIADRAPRVLVLGDALLDGWLSGPARRLGRDGPVPVVELVDSRSACGGAANTAANLAALGATVDLLAVFGDDGESRVLRALLADAGVRTDACVIELGRTTPVKRRLVAGGQHVARYDVAPGTPPRRSTRSALVDALTEALTGTGGERRPDAVLVADYGLGVADRRGPRAARRAARRDPAAGRRRPRPAGLE